jgi:hypothetical protein
MVSKTLSKCPYIHSFLAIIYSKLIPRERYLLRRVSMLRKKIAGAVIASVAVAMVVTVSPQAN